MASRTRRTDRTRTESLPYVYARSALEFEVTTYSVDDSRPGKIEGDHDRELSLETWSDWETTTIKGTITIPEDVIDRVFPEPERDDPPGKLIITADCLNTHNRFGTIVTDGSDPETTIEAAEYDWEVNIEREEVMERVVLNAFLVRTEDGDHGTRYASYKGQRLADGWPWRVKIDELEDWLGGHMVVRFKSFSDSPATVPDDNIYYLDKSDSEQPKVWVNSDHAPIKNTLSSGGYTGFRPRMRDVISDSIAHQIWVELLLWTASDVTEDGDWNHTWQQSIIEEIGTEIYDDLDDPVEIAKQLHTDINETENIPRLMSDIDEALQQYINPDESLNDMIRREGP